jgi:hypothetical protein
MRRSFLFIQPRNSGEGLRPSPLFLGWEGSNTKDGSYKKLQLLQIAQ